MSLLLRYQAENGKIESQGVTDISWPTQASRLAGSAVQTQFL